MLLAEKFVLLALNADGTLARGAGNHAAAAVGVTAALVTELAQLGHLDLTGGRIVLTGSRPAHPLLAQALDNLVPHEGKKLKNRLAAVRHAGWREVVDGMVDAGIIGREKHPLQATRHPVTDFAAHFALLADMRSAAVGTGPMDPSVTCLLALAGPSQHLEVVAPNRADRDAARKRISQAAETVPAAAAVKYVVEAAAAASAAGASAATTAAVISG